jgi:hypothetical protein
MEEADDELARTFFEIHSHVHVGPEV